MTEPLDAERTRRLRWIITADALVAMAGGTFSVAVFLIGVRIPALFWIGVVVFATSGVMATGLIPLRRGDHERALQILAVSNWIIAIIAAAVATFAWPLLMVTALLPSVVAASFVERDRLRWYVVPSALAALTVTAVGVLQDVTGLTERSPEWLKETVLLVTAPGFAAVLVFVSLQHHLNLTRALEEERAARRDLADQAVELRRSRQRVVAATDRERRRIERNLHDGAQSRLVGVNLKLAAARALLRHDPVAADQVLDDLRVEVHRAHAELRELAHGLYPTVLTQHGLVAAIEAAVDRSSAPVRLDLKPVGRLPSVLEGTIYFCVLEALNNAARHAAAERVDVRLGGDAGSVWFEVADDGVGLTASVVEGHGLTNLRDRLGAVGGRLVLSSNGGRGTSVSGRVPVES